MLAENYKFSILHSAIKKPFYIETINHKSITIRDKFLEDKKMDDTHTFENAKNCVYEYPDGGTYKHHL